MYWQKRFDRQNPDQEIEKEMLRIRKQHKDYSCLRMTKELTDRGFRINKNNSSIVLYEAKNETKKSSNDHFAEPSVNGYWNKFGFDGSVNRIGHYSICDQHKKV